MSYTKSNLIPGRVKMIREFKGRDKTAFAAVALFDVHLCPKRPEDPAWTVAKKFIRDIRPQVIVIGGDFLDFNSLAHFNKNKPLLVEGLRYKDECELGFSELEKIRNDLPTTDIIFMEGNHEYRITRYCEENPEHAGGMSITKDMHLPWLGIHEVVPFNEVLKIGKMHFIHGWYYNMYHAKKTLLYFGENIMYGHVHEYQVHQLIMRARERPYQAISCGCLSSTNPDYKRGFPTRFNNGLGLIEYRDNGHFNAYHVNIVDGELSYGGYTWTA